MHLLSTTLQRLIGSYCNTRRRTKRVSTDMYQFAQYIKRGIVSKLHFIQGHHMKHEQQTSPVVTASFDDIIRTLKEAGVPIRQVQGSIVLTPEVQQALFKQELTIKHTYSSTANRWYTSRS